MAKYRDPRTGTLYDSVPNTRFLPSGLSVDYLEIVDESEIDTRMPKDVDKQAVMPRPVGSIQKKINKNKPLEINKVIKKKLRNGKQINRLP